MPVFEKMSHHDRLVWMKSKRLETPDLLKVGALCGRLWRCAGIVPGGGMVAGHTGLGKSTAVAEYVDRLADQLRAEQPDREWLRPDVPDTPIRPIWSVKAGGYQRPVTVVVVNARPKYNSLLQDTCLALGLDVGKTFDFGDLQVQLNEHITKQECKMLIFDEVQHIIEAGTMDAYKAADVIKLMIKHPMQVLCIGLPSMLGLVQGPKKNPQLERLRHNQFTLQPMSCNLDDFPPLGPDGKPVDDIHHPLTSFRKICAKLDDRTDSENIVLPFDKSSDISHPQTALRLWRAFGGYIGQTIDFLAIATDLALEKGMKNLTPRVMGAAYRDMTECPDANNWFLMDWSEFNNRFHAPIPVPVHDKNGNWKYDNPLSSKH